MKELFGQRLREQRLKQNLTLEQLAEKANLSPNYVGMVERGLKEPGLATILSISAEVRCHIRWYGVVSLAALNF